MKSIVLIAISILCFYGTSLFAQDSNFLLQPQPGKKYIYRFNESTYLQDQNGEKLNEFLRTKILEIEYRNSEADNKKLLNVTVTKNTACKPDDKPFTIQNYKYPEFRDGFYYSSNKSNDFYETLLCEIVFKYEFNDETSEVKLYNRIDILLQVRDILDKKGFPKTLKDRRTEDFNKIAIPAITKIVQALYLVNSEMLDPEQYETKLDFGKPLINITNKQWGKKNGIYELNFSINTEDRYLIEHQQIQQSTK